MAVSADYNDIVNANPTYGIYGIYNNFIVRLTTDETIKFKTSYRLKITIFDETAYQSTSILKDIEVNNQTDKIGIVNPVQTLRERYFSGDFASDILETFNSKAYTKVKIEVGETYATLAEDPATFQGYDTEDVFYFYNGFESDDQNYRQLNYRDANWYDTTPIKLPSVQKTNYVSEEDSLVLSAPSEIQGNFGGLDTYNLINIIWNSYTVDGIPVDTTTIDLSARPSLSPYLGYWSYNVTPTMYGVGTYFNNSVVEYVEVYFQYEPTEGGFINTELIRFYREKCISKYKRYRLRWLNRYGADEYLNFIAKAEKSLRVAAGKNIVSDNIDYNASSYAAISNTEDPNLIEFGKSGQISYNINSDYLTQEQVDSLTDLYKSPKVLMYDEDNNAIPVIVQDRTYKIVDLSNELAKVSVNLLEANRDPNQIQ